MIENCLLPTAYFPSVDYFYFIAKSQKVIIEQFETFQKQTLRNRTYILSDKGKTMLSVPISKPNGNYTKTKDIKICYHENWIQKHWKAIESAYNPSPFFLYYKDPIIGILEKRREYLVDLNNELLEFFIQKLKIQATISCSSRFYKESEDIFDCNIISMENNETFLENPPYHQVFDERYGFISHLSILDLLCNKGPEAGSYINSLKLNKIS